MRLLRATVVGECSTRTYVVAHGVVRHITQRASTWFQIAYVWRVNRSLFVALATVAAGCPKHGDSPKPIDGKRDAGAARLLDTDGGHALALAAAPALPAVPHGLPDPPSLPRPEDVSLGELLFYDARLSVEGKLSCASCHAPGSDYAGARDATATGQPNLRRTPSLGNLAWATAFGWDGRYTVLADQLAAHAKGQLGQELSVARVAELPLYAAHFERVGGADPAHAIAALAAFITTRYDGDAPWDRMETEPRHDTPIERGYALFRGKAQCATCHTPPLYTDLGYHRLGLIAIKDDGRGRVDPASAGAFKTPSLRGAALRPSFFHDGSATTLEAAIDWHLAGGVGQGADPHIVDLKPVVLSAAERAALVDYVRALTSKAPSPTPPMMP